jgi:hypothetical protein
MSQCHQVYPSQKLILPDNSFECRFSYTSDPQDSGVDCGTQMKFLRKMINGRVQESDPDLHFLWNKFSLTTEQQYELMAFEKGGGGQYSMEVRSACAVSLLMDG